jgi:hypothetical protein
MRAERGNAFLHIFPRNFRAERALRQSYEAIIAFDLALV